MEDDTKKDQMERESCHECLVKGLRTAREQDLGSSITIALIYISIAGMVEIPPDHRQDVYDEVKLTIAWIKEDWPEMVKETETELFEIVLKSFESYLDSESSEDKKGE